MSEYARTGTLSAVSATTGISRRTLSDWRRSDWWDQLLRQEDGEAVSGGEVNDVESEERSVSDLVGGARTCRNRILIGAI